jgi:predicted PurR-regulated permease PerM
MDKPIISPLLQYLIGAAALVLVAAGLKTAAPVVTLILLAFLLAFSVSPILRWFLKRRLKPGLALLLTLLVVLVGGLIVVSITAGSIVRLVDSLPKYEAGLTSLKNTVLGLLGSVGIDPSATLSEEKFSPSGVLRVAAGVLGVALDLLSNGLIIIVIMAFVLVELTRLYSAESSSEDKRSPFQQRFMRAGDDVVRYVSITGWNGFLNALANLGWLMILGVDFPVTWAFLSFLFNFVPNFGFILAVIPPALLAFLESGWLAAVLVVVGYVILNFVAENILKPRTMKKGLEISPLLTILSVIVWTWILGAAGTILAVPLTVTIQKLVIEQITIPIPTEGPSAGRNS